MAMRLRLKASFGFGASIVAGALIYLYVLPVALQTGWAVTQKLTGGAEACDWQRILRFYVDLTRFAEMYEFEQSQVELIEEDTQASLQQVRTSKGPLWIPIPYEGRGIGWLLAEHDWMVNLSPGFSVRPGDVVIDVGAHVGVFAAKALALGAAQVIAIEPDPRNVECLRRNLKEEIAARRLIVVEAGAWNEAGVITLHLGRASGWNSMVENQGYRSVEVPVRTIDAIVGELKLQQVDYIKMDIEGAEPQALQGALETLRRHRPTVMIDTYQWAHDLQVLRDALNGAGPGYKPYCGPCEPVRSGGGVIPHVTYYRWTEGES